MNALDDNLVFNLVDQFIPLLVWPQDPTWSHCCPPTWGKSSPQEPNLFRPETVGGVDLGLTKTVNKGLFAAIKYSKLKD